MNPCNYGLFDCHKNLIYVLVINYVNPTKVFSNTKNGKCMKLQSKMILYVAIGGLFVFMGGIVYFSTFDLPELEKS